jgi:hypothetical protein
MPTKAEYAQARLDYESDPTITYKILGDRLGVSHQAVQKRGKKEGWVKAEDGLSKVVQDLPIAQPKEGRSLGLRTADNLAKIVHTYAITGNKKLSAGVVGITDQTLRNWCKEDEEFLLLMSASRKAHLVNQFEKIASARDWKAAKEILSRAPETKDEWGEVESKGPTIVLNILRE